MTYKVRILRRARQDVTNGYEYIAERSSQGADEWFAAIASSLERLSRHPESLAVAAESIHVNYEIRQALFKTSRGKFYRILFTTVDDHVRVLRIRGPGQDFVPSHEIQKQPRKP